MFELYFEAEAIIEDLGVIGELINYKDHVFLSPLCWRTSKG
jgi:hypothetical protein